MKILRIFILPRYSIFPSLGKGLGDGAPRRSEMFVYTVHLAVLYSN